MDLNDEDLALIRRALEIFEDRINRLYKGSTHEPLRKIYRKDLDSVDMLRTKLLEMS